MSRVCAEAVHEPPFKPDETTMLIDRLRWYGLETAQLLRRRWQALTLGLLILLPAMMPLAAQAEALGQPVLAPLAPSHGFAFRLAWIVALESLAVAWAVAQRRAVTGGAFTAYLRSLPVPDARRRVTDAVVMLAADTPLLVPIGAAAMALTVQPAASAYGYLLGVVLIAVALQLHALQRNARALLPLGAADLCLVYGIQAHGALQATALFAACGIAAATLAHAPVGPRAAWFNLRRARIPAAFSARKSTRVPTLFVTLARLNFGIVRAHGVGTLMRGVCAGALVAAAGALDAIWAFDMRAVGLSLLVQAMLATIAAGIYRDLLAAHQRAAYFTSSLPWPRAIRICADLATVAALYLPWAALLPVWLAAHGALTYGSACALTASNLPLLACLYLPTRITPRHALPIGATSAALWTAVLWSIFL